jgi:rRNA-processing protein FCF1
MLILISDANILIDLEDGHLIFELFQLPYEFVVPDILFESELRERHSHFLKAGLNVRGLNSESIKKIEFLTKQYHRPSIMDHAALALAIQEKGVLLTGDKALRSAATNEGVESHGTIWIVDQLIKHKIINEIQAKEGFDAMKVKGSRLPWSEVEKCLTKWGLIGAISARSL